MFSSLIRVKKPIAFSISDGRDPHGIQANLIRGA